MFKVVVIFVKSWGKGTPIYLRPISVMFASNCRISFVARADEKEEYNFDHLALFTATTVESARANIHVSAHLYETRRSTFLSKAPYLEYFVIQHAFES